MGFKSGFIALVGLPNVGKSTILNYFSGEKVAIVSPKPQTTRNVIRGIITTEEYQTIFLDTPGIHMAKNKLGQYMVNVANSAIGDVDCVVMVCDGSRSSIREIEKNLIGRIDAHDVPRILALNKVDAVQKKDILPLIDEYSHIGTFNEIIPVSARTGDGMKQLFESILNKMPEGPKYFPDDYMTDMPEKFMCAEFIRESILKNTRDELPHGTGVEIDSFKERPGGKLVDIEATIYCEKKSHKSILIGKDGEMLKKIGSESRLQIENLLGCKVFLKLWVKVKDGWRDNSTVLKDLGYYQPKEQ